MYQIKIDYSWGDEEEAQGAFTSKEEAFREMVNMAAKECYVQNEEFIEDNPCELYVDAFNYRIDLHYDYDDTWCYYRVVKGGEN